MYLDFFSFTERPFGITPDTRFYYGSRQHDDAVRTILFGIKEGRGFMLLSGEVGTGKTITLRMVLNRLGTEVESSLVLNPLISVSELLHVINQDFGLEVKSDTSVRAQIEILNQFLLKKNEEGKKVVVIIDEAQNLSEESLEMLRLLSNLETEQHKLLQMILVGQPELVQRLQAHSLRQLRQRIQILYLLKPLTLEETKNYILSRVKKVSTKSQVEFQWRAIKKIHVYSQGIPRIINHLGDLVLMAAYMDDTHVVFPSLVDRVHREMTETYSEKISFWKRIWGGGKDVAHP